VLDDPQLRANGVVVETDDAGEGYHLTVSSPINVREAPKRRPSRAPDIGAHSLEVLRELGFDEAYVQALVRDGIVVTSDGNDRQS